MFKSKHFYTYFYISLSFIVLNAVVFWIHLNPTSIEMSYKLTSGFSWQNTHFTKCSVDHITIKIILQILQSCDTIFSAKSLSLVHCLRIICFATLCYWKYLPRNVFIRHFAILFYFITPLLEGVSKYLFTCSNLHFSPSIQNVIHASKALESYKKNAPRGLLAPTVVYIRRWSVMKQEYSFPS